MPVAIDYSTYSQYPEEQENFRQERLKYNHVQNLSEIWTITAKAYPDIVALKDPHAPRPSTLTYSQLQQTIRQFAAGLYACGADLQADSPQLPARVALFADNCARWLIADQGIMMAGAANAVRSSQAERQELVYILKDSGSKVLVVENKQTLDKLLPDLQSLPIHLVVILSDEEVSVDLPMKVVNFNQLLAAGEQQSLPEVKADRQTLATLIYTSGTTGQPKGVMLTHGNLLHQITTYGGAIALEPGDKFLSVLPSWHCYERSCEYFVLSKGCTMIYTNIRHIKADLKEFQPELLVGVPRLWENIYEGVQRQFREQPASKQKLVNTFLSLSKKYFYYRRLSQGLDLYHLQAPAITRMVSGLKALILAPFHALGDKLVYQKIRQATGGKVKLAISGGGSLAMHLEDFYEIIGLPILVGYGLTETSPVTNVRRPWHNLRGSSGQPLAATQNRIVDPETYRELPQGEQGLVFLKGPQIMQGYFNKPEATAKVLDDQGWFNSGDLGMITPYGDIVITGRAKDTIVLSNGENIEPQPIEDACLRSPYIDQIMLVGQDQRNLGAIIVANLGALEQWAKEQGLSLQFPVDMDKQAVLDLFRQELNREVRNRPGYRADDRIGVFRLISEPFSIDNGLLTQTLKVRRPVVTERYRDMINSMFN